MKRVTFDVFFYSHKCHIWALVNSHTKNYMQKQPTFPQIALHDEWTRPNFNVGNGVVGYGPTRSKSLIKTAKFFIKTLRNS